MQQVREAENQANRRLFTTADGSRIFDSSRPGGESRNRFSPCGITIPMHSTTKKITDRLRYKDARTKEMYDIFKAQDEQLQSRGRKITQDKVELRQLDNILSNDELKAKKAGNLGLSGAAEYNSATGRRTRPAF